MVFTNPHFANPEKEIYMNPLLAKSPLGVIFTTSLMLASLTAHAQQAPITVSGTAPQRVALPKRNPRPPVDSNSAQIKALKQQLTEQSAMLENMRQALGEQDARYQVLQRSVSDLQQAPQVAQRPVTAPLETSPLQNAQPGQNNADRAVQVGTAPVTPDVSRAIAPLFEQPGVLTPKGKGVFEPSLQYGYSSSNRVALVGYTVIPALLIGLVDVREVKRNTLTGAVAVRYGLTNRFEIEGKLPYVYRSDSTVSRPFGTGAATDNVFNASGRAIGDVEVTGRYQLTDGSATLPYMIGSLRYKTRTGRDPFEVVSDCQTRCVSQSTGTGQPLSLPTGSGFTTLQPGLTWLYPSDPAVFFGSFTYGYNFKRTGVSRQVLNGESEFIGDIKPGDVLGMNVGMGLALNDRSTFSLGIDLNSIGRTKVNGVTVPTSVRTQLASLMLGFSHRYNNNRTINVSVAAGLTRDTPDLTLNVRIPFNF